MKKNQMLVIALLVVAATVILAGCSASNGMAGIQLFPTALFTPKAVSIPTPTRASLTATVPANVSATSPTTGWKTYKNQWFSIKYPPDWKYWEASLQNPSSILLILFSPLDDRTNEIFIHLSHVKLEYEGTPYPVTADGIPGVEAVSNNPLGPQWVFYLDPYTTMQLQAAEGYQDTLTEMVSTLTFPKPAPTPTIR
jgi:hypothetical protein